MEPDGDSPPIWSPPTTLFIPVRRRRPSPILNPVAVIIAIPILILLIIFFVVAPFLSHTNQILRQFSSVTKGWDSLNIVLVLFAIFCGVFARRNNENSSSDDADADHDQQNVDTISNVSDLVSRGRDSVLSYNWLDFPDRKEYNKMSVSVNSGGSRLMRSSSSYPDLRQESLWESDGNRSKFFDDSEVNFHRTTENFYSHGRRSHKAEQEAAEKVDTKIPVDKYVVKPVPPSPTHQNSQAPMPPPPPPPPPVKRRRSVHSVPQKEKVERERNEDEFNENGSAAPPPVSPVPPPPPPPPPGPEFYHLAERREKIQRKKSGTTKEIATAIASLYQGSHGKRKKKVKSRVIYESATQNSSPPSVIVPPSTPPPPPPPPPPPASKVLQNLFKKSSKSKRVHSVPTTAPPPPPPPPPPNSIFNNIFKTASKSTRFQLSSASSQPPPPPPPPPPSSILNSLFKTGTKSRRFQNLDNPPLPLPPPPPPPPDTRRRHRTVNTGKPPKPAKPSTSYHENKILAPPSPLIPMPPPPPPPPFRMPETKFVAKGDFVRIRSANCSRCNSPELEDVDVASVKSDGGDSIGVPISCPSPDVNSKADTFISRLKDEWRLEKMNSMKEKRQSGSLSIRAGPHA